MYLDANYFVTMKDGKSGPKFWPLDWVTAPKEIIEPILKASLFAPSSNGEFYVKQHWTVPKTHNYVPKLGVKTAHPLLILSTMYDPICPLVSARSANKAFVDSLIVEVKRYGHCSVAVASACIAKHVRVFSYNGIPKSYTQCEADGPYFIKPEQDEKALTALREFDDPEDMKIHMAQLHLANDTDCPLWSPW
jgi:hypothetical protein